MKRIRTGLLVVGLIALVTGIGSAGVRAAVGALADSLGLRERILERAAERLAAFRADPVGGIMKGLDTRLGLSASQKAEIVPLLNTLQKKLRDAHAQGPKVLDPALIRKFQDGTLAVDDVKNVMKIRRERMAQREADVIDTVQAVYSLLDETQRRIVANLARRRIEMAREGDPQTKMLVAARVLGLPDDQAERIRSILQPLIDEIRPQALNAIADFETLPTVIEQGKLTTADLHRVADRRKAIVAAHEEKIATAIHQVIGTLTAEQRGQALALLQRLRPTPTPTTE